METTTVEVLIVVGPVLGIAAHKMEQTQQLQHPQDALIQNNMRLNALVGLQLENAVIILDLCCIIARCHVINVHHRVCINA